MTRIFTFEVPGKPIPHSRVQVPARDGSGRTFNVLTKHARQYQVMVAAFASRAATSQQWELPPTDVPLRITVQAFWPYPKSTRVADRQRMDGALKMTRPDMSNVLKNIEDAISHTGGPDGSGAIAFHDDATLADLRLTKRWCAPGDERIEVEIEVLDQFAEDMFDEDSGLYRYILHADDMHPDERGFVTVDPAKLE